MPFSVQNKIITKHYRLDKNSGVRRLLTEFPNKGWTFVGLKDLLKKIDETGSIERREGSGRPKSVRVTENIENVQHHILSQDDTPGSHMTPIQISKELGISRTSVRRIIQKDLLSKKCNNFKAYLASYYFGKIGKNLLYR